MSEVRAASAGDPEERPASSPASPDGAPPPARPDDRAQGPDRPDDGAQGPDRPAEAARTSTFGPDFLAELFRSPLDPGYADAADRRAREGPRSGWRHGGLRTVSIVTALVIGVLFAVAYRQTVAEEPGRSRARTGLVSQVNERQGATDALQERADRLRDEVARQRDAALAGNQAARLRNMEAATGLARVRGDGVKVVITDAPSAVDAVTGTGKGQDLGRVFDRDLQYIANALWAGGAEAVAINGQRLTATSTIRSAGRAILVDFRPVMSPYEVTAIGPDDLRHKFAESPTARLLRSLVSTYGMSYDVHEVEDLSLPAASGPQLRFAKPDTTPTTGPSHVPSGAVRSNPVPSTNPPGGGP